MFERILLPLDGSELAEAALPYGEELLKRFDSELILFHARGPEHEQYEHMHQMYLSNIAETVEHNVRKGQPKDTEVKVTTKVQVGNPDENICKIVDENDVGLIVMATVSTSGNKLGKMIGSVTDYVCRTVPIPVMLIRPQVIKPIDSRKRLINRILLPLDGSDLSQEAIPVAEELAVKLKVPITLFQMAEIVVPSAGGRAPVVDHTKWIEALEQAALAETLKLEKKSREKGITVTHSVTSGHDAAKEIIETGKKVGADLIVMSTHGRSGVGRWVLGSVAEKVLRYSETPLMLVNFRAI